MHAGAGAAQAGRMTDTAGAPEGRYRYVEGDVRYRMRKTHGGVASSIRLLVEADGYSVWITWPDTGVDTVRPGDSVAFIADLTRAPRDPRTAYGTRVLRPRRTGRPHEQHDRR